MLLLLFYLAVARLTAGASPALEAADPSPAEDAQVTVAAPAPEQSQGVRVQEPPDASDDWEQVRAAAMLVPARTGELLLAPPRTVVWMYERYQLRYWFERVFFTDSKAIGVFPIVGYQSAYGFTAGLRGVARGRSREWLSLQTAYGGQFRQLYRAAAGTGNLLGPRLQVVLGVHFEMRPKDRFFGIGNGDLRPIETAPVPVDALTSEQAYSTRFQVDELRAFLSVPTRTWDVLTVQLSSEVAVRWFGAPSSLSSGEANITDIYSPSTLIGFNSPSTRLYTELAASIDRRQASRYVRQPSRGWFTAFFFGHGLALSGDEVAYLRYGTDTQWLVNLYDHTRVLALRLFVDGVVGGRADVPFLDLPRLGGAQLLRGYDYDRFRDRLAGLVTAEYRFDLGDGMGMALFVDAGRVWRSWSQLSLDDMRVGFGTELRIYMGPIFLFRAQVAGSIDGDVFFRFVFDPMFDMPSRVRR